MGDNGERVSDLFNCREPGILYKILKGCNFVKKKNNPLARQRKIISYSTTQAISTQESTFVVTFVCFSHYCISSARSYSSTQ